MKRIITALILVLALSLACVAVAEESTGPSVPESGLKGLEKAPEEETAPEEENAPEGETTPEDEPLPDANSSATEHVGPQDEELKAALEALYEARQSAKLEKLQAELDEYVAAGKLTQEQADLIMKYYREKMESRQSHNFQHDKHRAGKQQDNNNQFGGEKQYGNWKFKWSFGFGFPSQNEDNLFPGWQMPGWQQNGDQQCPGMQGGSQCPCR